MSDFEFGFILTLFVLCIGALVFVLLGPFLFIVFPLRFWPRSAVISLL